MLFYFALCCTLIIISGPKIKRAVDIEGQEVFSNEEYLEKKLDSLYPSAESLVSYSVHCSLTEGSTKEIDIGFPNKDWYDGKQCFFCNLLSRLTY